MLNYYLFIKTYIPFKMILLNDFKKIINFSNFLSELIFFSIFNILKFKSIIIPKSKCSSKALFNKKVFIIGAGPSLNQDLNKIKLIPDEDEIFVSNWFALTELWEELKPRNYIIADPGLWNDDYDGTHFQTKKLNLYKVLFQVKWNLNLYIPDTSLKFIKPILKNNSNINFIVFPTRSSYQENIKSRSTLIYSRIVPPKICNGILVAIWISIMSKSKSIFLYGVDSDGFRKIETDQKTNEVRTGLLHFYDKKYIPEKKKKSKLLYQRFEQTYIMFREYKVISMVAKSIGIKIINLSSYSMLDNFERK